MPERDDDLARFAGDYTREQVIDAIDAAGGQASTQAVADELGCDRATAYEMLDALQEDTIIEDRQVGRSLEWSLADRED